MCRNVPPTLFHIMKMRYWSFHISKEPFKYHKSTSFEFRRFRRFIVGFSLVSLNWMNQKINTNHDIRLSKWWQNFYFENKMKWNAWFLNHIILFGLVSVNYSNTDGLQETEKLPWFSLLGGNSWTLGVCVCNSVRELFTGCLCQTLTTRGL